MKHIIGKIAICFLAALCSGIRATSVRMEIADSKGKSIESVIVGIPFQLRFIIKGNSGSAVPHIVCPDNLVIKHSGKQIHSVNGSVTTIYNYTAIASAEQTYTVGPGTVTIHGSLIKAEPIVFEALISQAQSNSSIKNTTDHTSKPFIECMLQKASVFVGEIVSCTLRFYCPSHIHHILLKQIQTPQSNNYLIIQKGSQKEGVELIKQKPFKYIEWEFDIQFLKEGNTFLPPFNAEYTIEDDDDNVLFGGLSIFFQHNQLKQVQSNILPINVKPIPDYKGKSVTAIGHFTDFSASVTPTAIAINDATIFSLRLTGNGNLSMINHLRLTNIPSSVQVYESQSKIELNNQTNQKTKLLDYIMQVEEPGLVNIPSQKFIFFDPITEKHVVIKTNPITFDVKPNEQKSTHPLQQNQSTQPNGIPIPHYNVKDTDNDNSICFMEEEGSCPWLLPFTYTHAIFLLFALLLFVFGYIVVLICIPIFYETIQYRCAYLHARLALKKLEKSNNASGIITVFKKYVSARRFYGHEPDYNSFLTIISTVLKDQKNKEAWHIFYANLTEAAYGSLHEINIKNTLWEQAYYWLYLLKKKGM